MSGPRRLVAIATAVFALALVCSTGAASAATYVERPCTGNMYTDWISWDWLGAENWFVSGNCPEGYAIYPISDMHEGDPEGRFSMELSQGEIQSITGRLVRDPDNFDGVIAGVQACRFAECGEVIEGDASADFNVELTKAAGQIPDGATRVIYRARCSQPDCAGQAPVTLADLTVTRSDFTPPDFTLDEYDDNYQPIPPARAKWNKGKVHYGFLGDDPESKLAYYHLEVGPIDECGSLSTPDVTVPGCTMLELGEEPVVLASDLPDGHHQLAVTLGNGAGLEKRLEIPIKTDATPPARPSQFTTAPKHNGWENDRNITISWANTTETVEDDTHSGIVGFRYDIDPLFGGINPPASTENPPEETVSRVNPTSLAYRFPSSGQWSVTIKTFDAAGNESQPGTVDVNIDDAHDPAPVVAPIAPINAASAQAGVTLTWNLPWWSVSGICGHNYAFSPVAGFNPGDSPNSPTIAGWATSVNLTPTQVQALSERPQRFHIRALSCAGLAGEITHEPVTVDFTAPALALAPAGGTIRAGEPVFVSAQDVKSGTIQSGVDAVSCLVDGVETPCANGEALDLEGGRRHVVVSATDKAGNTTVAEGDYVVDSGGPTGWIEPSDPNDPTLVRATVTDADTGVASAMFEYRSEAGGDWIPLDQVTSTTPLSEKTLELTARIPDDGELPDGDYRLRVRAVDRAGTSSFVTDRAGATAAGFQIPLRAAANIDAGLRRSAKARSAPLSRLAVDYGDKPVIAGALRSAGGVPLAGRVLTVESEERGAPRRTIAIGSTAADGGFSIPLPPGGSRELTLRYGGGRAERPVSAKLNLLVRGRLTLRRPPARVRSGRSVRLRGTVYHHGTGIPLRGKRVEIEIARGPGGAAVTLKKHTDAAGRFDVSFKVFARGHRVRFKVRAVAVDEPTWPFEEAASKYVRFEVRP